jgi:peptidoglycan/xylan/chitin deacetylase (PgdA/CDA1 family)
MAGPNIVFLMYHELELPGRAMCQSEPGYVRYIVPEAVFRSQMNWLRQQGWRGLSVGEALKYPAAKSVAITFDDGSETDLIAAAPVLKDIGYNATFYVTSGFLDKTGYMSSAQLRELSSLGFEIGCHSMTHPNLNDLSEAAQCREIVEARLKLEDITGRKVDHFSCPGGRYNATTLRIVRESEYRTLATSHVRANAPGTNPFKLGRAVVMRDTNDTAFQQICTGDGLWKMRLSESTRGLARNVLGNRIYNRVRARLLRES